MSGVSGISSGNPWSNPGNVNSSSQFADSFIDPSGESAPLLGTNFGFTIPSGALIQGILFTFQKFGERHVNNFIDDAAIGASPIGTADRSQPGNWPLEPVQFTYGSSTDLWGASWTALDINGSGFGLSITAENQDDTISLKAFVNALYATVYYQINTGSPSNGGITAFERIGLYPMSDGNLWAFDPNSGYNDPLDGSSYFWRVEEIAVGRKPTISRIFCTYRDLGQVTTVWTLTAVDDSQKVVTNSATRVLGNTVPTGYLMTAEIDLPLSGMNMQLSVSRKAGAGPLSIAKVKVCGRVETDSYS